MGSYQPICYGLYATAYMWGHISLHVTAYMVQPTSGATSAYMLQPICYSLHVGLHVGSHHLYTLVHLRKKMLP